MHFLITHVSYSWRDLYTVLKKSHKTLFKAKISDIFVSLWIVRPEL